MIEWLYRLFGIKSRSIEPNVEVKEVKMKTVEAPKSYTGDKVKMKCLQEGRVISFTGWCILDDREGCYLLIRLVGELVESDCETDIGEQLEQWLKPRKIDYNKIIEIQRIIGL